MHIQDILEERHTTCSFEFFPPKGVRSSASLFANIMRLQDLKPSFVSVTYGAGGSTRELTHDLVLRLQGSSSLRPIPHLTCVCHQEAEIQSILERYAEAGIANVLALRGDAPADRSGWNRSKDAFRYATDLVRYVKEFSGHPDPKGFGIGVAGFPEGHPETPNRLLEMDYLKAKVDAGADYIVTQLFFDNRDFFDFRDRCRIAGIEVPILAGIMPVTAIKSMKRMADLAAGARFPAPLLSDLKRCQDDPDAVAEIGIHHATAQCRDLIHHEVRGIHFYTLNKSDATVRIYKQLGLRDSAMLT